MFFDEVAMVEGKGKGFTNLLEIKLIGEIRTNDCIYALAKKKKTPQNLFTQATFRNC